MPNDLTTAFAEGAGDPAGLGDGGTGDNSYVGSYIGSLLTVVIALVVIIGLIILLIRFLAFKNRSFMSNRTIRILGGVPLGQNKSLQIVEIGQKIYMIGVGEDIRLIDKIDDPEEVQRLADSLLLNGSGTGKEFFLSWIHRFKQLIWFQGTQHAEIVGQEERDENMKHSFQDIFQSKMKNLTQRQQIADQMRNEQSFVKDRSDEQ
ncbi:flagellar biosynthetic protein FliO [Ferviditalea candida]|uniref:flagellar biosynthetic protein FliO n=1 Tax=Ferviditalea candida TaxID=3108399 RepID=UPI00352CF7B6